MEKRINIDIKNLKKTAKNVKVNNNVIFFDFRTLENFRKKGFYQKLLKKMLVSFRSKDCFIYTTIFNIKSLKAINKSNFEFVNFFSIFKKKIDLN